MLVTLLVIGAAHAATLEASAVVQPIGGAPWYYVPASLERQAVPPPVGARVGLAFTAPERRLVPVVALQLDGQRSTWSWEDRSYVQRTWLRIEPMVGTRLRLGNLDGAVVPTLFGAIGAVMSQATNHRTDGHFGPAAHLGAGVELGAGDHPVTVAVELRGSPFVHSTVPACDQGRPGPPACPGRTWDAAGSGLSVLVGWTGR